MDIRKLEGRITALEHIVRAYLIAAFSHTDSPDVALAELRGDVLAAIDVSAPSPAVESPIEAAEEFFKSAEKLLNDLLP